MKVLHFGTSATSVELSCPPQVETLMGKIRQELFGHEELSYFGQRGGLAGPICQCRFSGKDGQCSCKENKPRPETVEIFMYVNCLL